MARSRQQNQALLAAKAAASALGPLGALPGCLSGRVGAESSSATTGGGEAAVAGERSAGDLFNEMLLFVSSGLNGTAADHGSTDGNSA